MVSVIVRFHDPARFSELRRCLFSLLCQSYQPLEICLVTQRFSSAEIQSLEAAVQPLLSINPSVLFRLLNYEKATPIDARSALLNLGIERSQGNYLAFLDYDDTILYPAYSDLIQEIQQTSAAIAFASVAYKDAEVFEDTLLVRRRLEAFVGKDLKDLFDHNFCPIHSFVIDRSKVETADLHFDESLTRHEDYDFLLRLCAKYNSSFRLIGTFIGDYYLKSDGSNSNRWLMAANAEDSNEWDSTAKDINGRKSQILLSANVQQQLALPTHDPALTIERFLQHVIMGEDDHS